MYFAYNSTKHSLHLLLKISLSKSRKKANVSLGTLRISAVLAIAAFFLSTTLPARAETGAAPGTPNLFSSTSASAVASESAVASVAEATNEPASEQAQQTSPPPSKSQENLPNAPSSTQTQPSLSDLGFSPAESQADAQRQALLDKRTHMLKIHQRMGLITAAPLIATLVTSLNAGGRNESSASRDLHVGLGALTGDLYGITAWYAIRAPRIPGTETRGPIRVHKILAWIHGPGMIATPILGAMAFNQRNNGQKVHGIAQAHAPVAIITAGAFGAALLSVSMKF